MMADIAELPRALRMEPLESGVPLLSVPSQPRAPLESLSYLSGEQQERLLDAQIRNTKQKIINHVKSQLSAVQVTNDLMKIDCAFSKKFTFVDFVALLQNNSQTLQQLQLLLSALSILEKYGRNLLQPQPVRPKGWRIINFSNAVFRSKIDGIAGSRSILVKFGYTQEMKRGIRVEGLVFPTDAQPQVDVVAAIVADIMLGVQELEAYLNGQNPNKHRLDPYISQTVRIPSRATANAAGLPSLERKEYVTLAEIQMLQKQRQQQQLATGKAMEKADLGMAGQEVVPTVPHEDCDICGDSSATMKCLVCDGKVLCPACDEMWHRHPKRKDHMRHFISALSTAPPGENITQQSTAPPSDGSGNLERQTSAPSSSLPWYALPPSGEEVIRVIPGRGAAGSGRNGPNQNKSPSIPSLQIEGVTAHYPPQETKGTQLGVGQASAASHLSPLSLPIGSKGGGGDGSQTFASHSTPSPSSLATLPSPLSPKQSETLLGLKKIEDPLKRNDRLDICVLELDEKIEQYDERITSLIAENDDFMENSSYMVWSRHRDRLKREKMQLLQYQKDELARLLTDNDSKRKEAKEDEETVKEEEKEDEEDISFEHLKSPPVTYTPPPVVSRTPPTQGPASLQFSKFMAPPAESGAVSMMNLGDTRAAPPFGAIPETPPPRQHQSLAHPCQQCKQITDYNRSRCHFCYYRISGDMRQEAANLQVHVAPPGYSESPGTSEMVVPPLSAVSPSQGVPLGDPQSPGEPTRNDSPSPDPLLLQSSLLSSIVENTQKYSNESPHRSLSGSDDAESFEMLSHIGYHVEWECEHCTFVNPPNTRVCDICDKTSLRPQLREEATKPAVAKAKGKAKKSVHKIDEVPLKKSSAQMVLPRPQGHQSSGASPAPQNRASSGSGVPMSLVEAPSARRNLAANLELSEITHSLGLLNMDTSAGTKKERDMFVKPKLDMQHHLESIAERRQREQLLMEGRGLIRIIRAADTEGFDVSEVEIALRMCPEGSNPIGWLKEKWRDCLDTVQAMATQRGQMLDVNTVGEVSVSEAKEALMQTEGDVQKAADVCVQERQRKVCEIQSGGEFDLDKILEALFQNKGHLEPALHQLNQVNLAAFEERIWRNDEDGNEVVPPAGDGQRSLKQKVQAVRLIKNKDIDFERRARAAMAEGGLATWTMAQNLVRIADMDDLDAEIDMDDIVEAVGNCPDVYSALVYLQQECATCMCNFPMSKIRTLSNCQCKNCVHCLQQHFEIQIREQHIKKWVCPSCSLPDIDGMENIDTYFQFLDLMLPNLLSQELYVLFQNKLRDWHLMKDPNFRWCSHRDCAAGFLYNGNERQLRMTCPDCNRHTCFRCKKPWEDQHEGRTCEEWERWKHDNDPERQAAGLAKHLEECGIDCPSCNFRYALAKGGCMHFHCTQCGHEFCSGCSKPFKRGANCTVFPSCKKAGLHCHHPRDCFYHMRDSTVPDLQKLLQDNNLAFNVAVVEGAEEHVACTVMEQKEMPDGLKDEPCGVAAPDNYAGLCEIHYKEYLVGLINKNNIDPVCILDLKGLKTLLKRHKKDAPKQAGKESTQLYTQRLSQFVIKEIPLPARAQKY